jgi:hypothetical protein
MSHQKSSISYYYNDIDRQQVATLARKIYPSSHAIFTKRLQNATSRPHGYLVVDIKSCSTEQDRLRENVFEIESPATTNRKLTDNDDDYDHDVNEKEQLEGGVKRQFFLYGASW